MSDRLSRTPTDDESFDLEREPLDRLMPREQREQLLEGLDQFRARTQRSAEAPPAHALPLAPHDPHRVAQEKARKHKHKRKIESASRKANRRKRK